MAPGQGRPSDRCDIDNEDFLRRLHARQPEALATLAEVAGPRMLGRIRSMVPGEEDADDLYQECWLHLISQLDKCTRPGNVVGWAVVVAANHCRSLLRRSKGVAVLVPLEDAGDIADTGADPVRQMEQDVVRRTVWTALDSLSKRQRDAVVLTLMEGRSNAEASVAMKVSPRNVRSLVSAAVRKLQERHELRQCFQDMCR